MNRRWLMLSAGVVLATVLTACGSTGGERAPTTGSPGPSASPAPSSGTSLGVRAPRKLDHPQRPDAHGTVTKVTDGDTVHVLVDGQSKAETVRIVGIDTPETKDPRKPVQCFGPQASDNAQKTLMNHRVTLVDDPTQSLADRYSRDLRYVDVDVTPQATAYDYGRNAVAQGFARPYVYAGVPVQRNPDYEAAMNDAKAKHLGLWAAKPAGCDGGL